MPRVPQDWEPEDVRRLQDGGLRGQGGAERGLAQSQKPVQNSSVFARKGSKLPSDQRLSCTEAGKVKDKTFRKRHFYVSCCIFQPAFGCCALQTLIKMLIFIIFITLKS